MYGLDNALVEYGKNDKAVSLMVKAHQAKTVFGVDSYQYTTILFGSSPMRHYENKIGNSFKAENFLRNFN